MQVMRLIRWLLRAMLVAAFAWQAAGCAALPEQDTMLVVKGDRFAVYDREYGTSTELAAALAEHHAGFVNIVAEKGAGYEAIGKAIYSVQRSGAQIRKVKWDEVQSP